MLVVVVAVGRWQGRREEVVAGAMELAGLLPQVGGCVLVKVEPHLAPLISATLNFGSGGGGGFENGSNPSPGGNGGAGGGGILILARSLIVTGILSSSGLNGADSSSYPGGAGSGGSIVLRTGNASLGTNLTSAIGGVGEEQIQSAIKAVTEAWVESVSSTVIAFLLAVPIQQPAHKSSIAIWSSKWNLHRTPQVGSTSRKM